MAFSSCHGCSLCLLACPVWRQTRDVRLTPRGRAKAMQHGASAADLRASIDSCTLCGACEPACPEEIPLVEMMLALRREQPLETSIPVETRSAKASGSVLLLPGAELRKDLQRLQRIAGLLDIVTADDDGSDISQALEIGSVVEASRLSSFLDSLSKAERLVVADGLLLRKLREWLPEMRIVSLGEALTALDTVRAKLRATDLYVIEPRAFHADQKRLVTHYDSLLKTMKSNLDLQRLAIPTCASSQAKRVDVLDQARWILEGRAFERVVVEDAADCAVFASVTDRPVVHVGDL